MEATQRERTSIEREVRIEASPETVFPFLTDSEQMVRWMGSSAELDARPGGSFAVDIAGHPARGEYVEVTPHERVVFTWGWDEPGNPVPPGSSTVEITLAPDGDGTRLRLVHSGLGAEAVEPHTHGWDNYVERLRIVAAGGDPGPDKFHEQAQG